MEMGSILDTTALQIVYKTQSIPGTPLTSTKTTMQ